MTELDDIYAPELLQIAANITHTQRLDNPDITAQAQSKLCGSNIEIDINIRNGRIVAFGQTVTACLLGQSAAAIMAKTIIGKDITEIEDVSKKMHAMLKGQGATPKGGWEELGLLEGVREFKARHASTLLIFSALEKAFATYKADKKVVS
ncbi:MAG: iron-sulfur cluster assembly scaffold protein [Pseudomonadota bacterium]